MGNKDKGKKMSKRAMFDQRTGNLNVQIINHYPNKDLYWVLNKFKKDCPFFLYLKKLV